MQSKPTSSASTHCSTMSWNTWNSFSRDVSTICASYMMENFTALPLLDICPSVPNARTARADFYSRCTPYVSPVQTSPTPKQRQLGIGRVAGVGAAQRRAGGELPVGGRIDRPDGAPVERQRSVDEFPL